MLVWRVMTEFWYCTTACVVARADFEEAKSDFVFLRSHSAASVISTHS